MLYAVQSRTASWLRMLALKMADFGSTPSPPRPQANSYRSSIISDEKRFGSISSPSVFRPRLIPSCLMPLPLLSPLLSPLLLAMPWGMPWGMPLPLHMFLTSPWAWVRLWPELCFFWPCCVSASLPWCFLPHCQLSATWAVSESSHHSPHVQPKHWKHQHCAFWEAYVSSWTGRWHLPDLSWNLCWVLSFSSLFFHFPSWHFSFPCLNVFSFCSWQLCHGGLLCWPTSWSADRFAWPLLAGHLQCPPACMGVPPWQNQKCCSKILPKVGWPHEHAKLI